MKTTIKFVGTNPSTAHLHEKTFAAEINYVGPGIGDDIANIHMIKLPDRNLFFDLKDTKVLDFVVLQGILQDGNSVGRVAIQLQ